MSNVKHKEGQETNVEFKGLSKDSRKLLFAYKFAEKEHCTPHLAFINNISFLLSNKEVSFSKC